MVTIFYYVMDIVYIYSWQKKIDKIFTHFGDATYQKYNFLATRGVQLDNEVSPPPGAWNLGVVALGWTTCGLHGNILHNLE